MDPIYLDHAATTPVRPEVRAAMSPFHDVVFGNPSSLHRWGRAAAAGLAKARADVAEALGADPGEIVFTRGGTESDNLALLGRCRFLRSQGITPSLAVSEIEHPAILDAVQALVAEGSATTQTLHLNADGSLVEEELERVLEAAHPVVSTMWVNNEIGVTLPVEDLATRVASAGGTFHSDAVQAVGKVPVSLADSSIHLLSVTGHKIYGPKGSGLLFVRSGTELAPVLHGGGQERRLRPGTEDVAGAVGLACAVRLAISEQADEAVRLRGLRDTFEGAVSARLDGVRVNAAAMPRAPHVTSLGILGVPGDMLLMALDLEGIAVSGGSACSSGASRASHVIEALHGPADEAATVRFSLGRATTEGHVDRAVETLVTVVERLRSAPGAA